MQHCSLVLVGHCLLYLLLFPLLRLINGMTPRCRVGSLIVLLGVYFVVIQFVPESLMHGLIYISPLFRMVDFILGMSLWYVYRTLRQPVFPTRCFAILTLIQLAVIAVVVLVSHLSPAVSLRYNQASLWWLPSMLVIFTFTALDNSRAPLTRMLHTRPLMWFGSISFEFYMVHLVTITTLCGMFPDAPSHPRTVACFVIAVVAAVLVKALINSLRRMARVA